MDEDRFMVCMRVTSMDDPVEGSTTTACVECGTDVWISAESRTEMYKVGAMPVCTECAERVAQQSKEPPKVHGPSAGQFGEMLQGLKDSAERLGMRFPDSLESKDIFETMQETAKMAESEMKSPKDDWSSMVVMVNFDDIAFPPLPLGKMLSSGIPKEVIAKQLIPGLAYTAQAKRVLFGMSTWSLETEGPPPEGGIGGHPDSKEKLCLIDVTADGVQRMAFADIIRDGVGPPRLGEWHDTERPEASDGLFVDALVPALQTIRTMMEGSSV